MSTLLPSGVALESNPITLSPFRFRDVIPRDRLEKIRVPPWFPSLQLPHQPGLKAIQKARHQLPSRLRPCFGNSCSDVKILLALEDKFLDRFSVHGVLALVRSRVPRFSTESM